MAPASQAIEVYLEAGEKRTFAGALAWPGWCRSGRDEGSALQALCDSGPRYANILQPFGIAFQPPADTAAFTVVERLPGNASTDFGAPGKAPAYDDQPLDPAELQRLQQLLQACWQAFDQAVRSGQGKELRQGPRGGGRELSGIVRHVLEAEAAYLRQLGGRLEKSALEGPGEAALAKIRPLVLETLAAAARGEVPARGPRGGARWSPRYFARRAAWHVLDHAWEIEDRSSPLD